MSPVKPIVKPGQEFIKTYVCNKFCGYIYSRDVFYIRFLKEV